MATGHSPFRKAVTPRWTATSDDEQAVSIVMLGPCQSKKYDTRLEMMARLSPVAPYVGFRSQSRLAICAQSSHIMPTYTAVFDPRSFSMVWPPAHLQDKKNQWTSPDPAEDN